MTKSIRFYGNLNIPDKKDYITFKTIDDAYYLTSILDLKEEPITEFIGRLNSNEPFSLFKTKQSKDSIISNLTNINWKYCNNLHVHHEYYQEGRLAWEYPDNALVTLCWDCHTNLHKETDIKILDKNGKNLGFRKVCTRCFGAGWFPEFNHIENGVCFKCQGSRFSE